MKFQIPKFLKGTDYTDKKNLQINTDVVCNEHELRTTNTVFDLSWVDEFIKKVKPYIYVRKLDRLLILIPNQAYKLNESGIAMLDFLLHGHSIHEFLSHIKGTEEKRRDIHHFFCDLRAAIKGCLRENEQREAISYYEFNGEFNEYPVLSEIAVTYRCNLKCEFCYVGDKRYGELNTNDTKKILFKIYHEANVPSVSFTGGEPLVRNDICTLVEYASNIGLWTNLITNATLLSREIVHNLKRAGLSSAQVSIEGPNPAVHDAITGIAGSFDMTMRGLKLLMKAEIPVHTNTTVSKNNIAHLEEIVLLAKDVGLSRLSMNLLIPCGSALHKQHLWVPYSDIGDYIMRLKRRAAEAQIKFLWYSPVPMCAFNPIAHGFGNKSCAAITGLLSIDPLGNIIPCSSWRMPVGSLLKQRFEDIWQSAMLNYFKNIEYAPSVCHECLSFDVCKGACPLYWKACGEGELGART
jgi:radical SAM protein with 4Fe4S-binding SPASM domain